MRKVYVALMVLFVGVWFYFAPSVADDVKSPEPKKIAESAEVKTVTAKPKPRVAVLPISPKEKKRIESTSNKPVYIIKERQDIDNAFEDADAGNMSEHSKPKPNVTPLNAFKMKKGTIKSLYAGDTLVLPAIGEFEYKVEAVSRKVNENGSVTVTASIVGEDPRYYSIMTEGEQTSFMTLNTSNGVYEMEIINGSGYTYSAAEVQDSMSDYTKTDTLTAPHKGHDH